MVRMQVQLPDELYARLKEIADAKEWSFVETLRRAGEMFASMYPQGPRPEDKWVLPKVDLGAPLLPEEKWAEAVEQDWIEERQR